MSKALDYLCSTRPAAMEAYFSFLRANGSRLDARTRALISIITKVANQTESGLKQYAGRAVREGVSADEILDAILMAFPALGLTKTVWAVDVLLECGIFVPPETAEQTDGAWHDVCAVAAVGAASVREVDGRAVYVSRHDDGFRVFEARCPHHGTTLRSAEVRGDTVECPLHGWRFDVTTGACTRFGNQGLPEFETQVADGRLSVYW